MLLTNVEGNRVHNILRNISGNKPYILDLEDYPLIERLFMMEYRKFFGSLCYYVITMESQLNQSTVQESY